MKISDQMKIKEEPHTEISSESTRQIVSSTTEGDISSPTIFDSNPLSSDHSSIPSQLTPIVPDSTSSSRSTSRTSSETKIDHIKVKSNKKSKLIFVFLFKEYSNNNNIEISRLFFSEKSD
jgi:hypothetical protein